MNTQSSTTPLVNTELGGRQVYRLENREAVLVKKDESGDWAPVDSIENPISDQQLDRSYGLWTDQQVTKGHLWWKETVREKDCQIQADEVRDFERIKKDSLMAFSTGGFANACGISEVAVKVGDGQAPVLEETWFFAP